MIDEKVSDVVRVTSKEGNKCKICGFFTDNFESAVNHMITEHDYRLKFFGTETYPNNQEMPFHFTVAMLVK